MFYLFLDVLRSQTTKEEFTEIVTMTDDDIKFNRVHFGKTTNLKQYIRICTSCTKAFSRTVTKSMKEILDSLDRIVDATFERSDKGTYKSLGEILSEEVKKVRNQEGNYAKHIN
ncbi:hypothetical protein BCD91_004387 [Clostridium beijerinckii]|uniref:hypothetical protein n=1 Tax=Clostridium TaxID=1485 RepID=UPI00149416F4|nr:MULTISPECIES: hypothetical protein [Clostridium]NOW92364.1 hypothetical protein [Clostridium beijerinckii]